VALHFYKYHGTGNDFILLDETLTINNLSKDQVAHLCHRHFGIGADGLIQLRKKNGFDFEMVYYNSDGNTSSMCGNGGRCISQFAKDLGLVNHNAEFLASDGPHIAKFVNDGIELKMIDTTMPEKFQNDFILNTGSPHYLQFVDNVRAFNVVEIGAKIRYNEAFKDKGINVNFIEVIGDNTIFVRTYERGVENETLSCGTGVTAAALTFASSRNKKLVDVSVQTLGGSLNVKFQPKENGFETVWLCGSAIKTFEGQFKF
jgi:diaminopimelate epimerase